MKTKRLLILYILLIFAHTHPLWGQLQTDTLTYRYANAANRCVHDIMIYKITNRSTDSYLTWVSWLPVDGKSDSALVYDFFRKSHGAASYFTLMYEGWLDMTPFHTEIGISFVKKIRPGESFSYFIRLDDTESVLHSNRIVIMEQRKVDEYLRGLVLDETYLFPHNGILL